MSLPLPLSPSRHLIQEGSLWTCSIPSLPCPPPTPALCQGENKAEKGGWAKIVAVTAHTWTFPSSQSFVTNVTTLILLSLWVYIFKTIPCFWAVVFLLHWKGSGTYKSTPFRLPSLWKAQAYTFFFMVVNWWVTGSNSVLIYSEEGNFSASKQFSCDTGQLWNSLIVLQLNYEAAWLCGVRPLSS